MFKRIALLVSMLLLFQVSIVLADGIGEVVMIKRSDCSRFVDEKNKSNNLCFSGYDKLGHAFGLYTMGPLTKYRFADTVTTLDVAGKNYELVELTTAMLTIKYIGKYSPVVTVIDRSSNNQTGFASSANIPGMKIRGMTVSKLSNVEFADDDQKTTLNVKRGECKQMFPKDGGSFSVCYEMLDEEAGKFRMTNEHHAIEKFPSVVGSEFVLDDRTFKLLAIGNWMIGLELVKNR